MKTPNTQTYWLLAQTLTRDWLTRDIEPTKRVGVTIADQLRMLLQRVLAVNPEAVEGWDAFARVEAFSPEPRRESLATIDAAVRRWPDDPQVPQIRVLLAFARHRLGADDVARALATSVIDSPQTAASTRSLAANLLGNLLPVSTRR